MVGAGLAPALGWYGLAPALGWYGVTPALGRYRVAARSTLQSAPIGRPMRSPWKTCHFVIMGKICHIESLF